MARDLSFPVDVVGMPLVREHDGLALSSRNVRLVGDARRSALAISRGLMAAANRYDEGCRSVDELTGMVYSHIEQAGSMCEYVAVADAATADPMHEMAGTQVLAVAASFDGVRLIDNVTIHGDTRSVDRGTRLTQPSILYGGP
jgi:pantoate--beta-alanine ligase